MLPFLSGSEVLLVCSLHEGISGNTLHPKDQVMSQYLLSEFLQCQRMPNLLLLLSGLKYRIHSNKGPGHLDKSFRVGTYLFQYLLIESTQNG